MYRFHSPDDRSESCSLQLPLPYEVREASKVTLDGPPPRLRVTLVREPGIEFDRVPLLSRPGEAAAFIESILEGADREHLGAIYLDARSRMIGYQIAYIGTLTRTIAKPRGIFSAALLCNAAAVLLFHNHPSSDTSPSVEDLEFTKEMARAGEILKIRVIDHLIVGEPGRWTSLKDRGFFKGIWRAE